MFDVRKYMKERDAYLGRLEEEVDKRLCTAPVGTLRISHSGGRTQYFHRKEPKDPNGVYIRDLRLARALAQKGYDEKMKKHLRKERYAIRRYLALCPGCHLEEPYHVLTGDRQKLVDPVIETAEQFVAKWSNVEFESKPFQGDASEFITERGERVRSKSELIIADCLYRAGVPYRYECPLHLKGMGRIHPDFTVLQVRLRKEMYWEHLGMMGDRDYANGAVRRIAAYRDAGIESGDRLILTYETLETPLSVPQIKKLIARVLL